MAAYLNHVTLALPRNGTTTHTCDPSNVTGGGTVVGGTAFTPTSGRFLLVFAAGAVTFTTPSGWTLPTNGSAVNNGGLYVFYKTSAGGDTFSSTNNGSNYPVVYDVYEYASGTTFKAASKATGQTNGATLSLASLTGTNTIFGAGMEDWQSTTITPTGTWTSGTTKSTDTTALVSGTDGYWYGAAYTDGVSATSQAYGVTLTNQGVANTERLMVAITVATSSAFTGSASVITANSIAATGAPNVVPSVSMTTANTLSATGSTGSGSATYAYRNSASVITGNAVASQTIVVPSDTLGGDHIYIVATLNATAGTQLPTAPSGFTTIDSVTNTAGTFTAAIFAKIAAGTLGSASSDASTTLTIGRSDSASHSGTVLLVTVSGLDGLPAAGGAAEEILQPSTTATTTHTTTTVTAPGGGPILSWVMDKGSGPSTAFTNGSVTIEASVYGTSTPTGQSSIAFGDIATATAGSHGGGTWTGTLSTSSAFTAVIAPSLAASSLTYTGVAAITTTNTLSTSALFSALSSVATTTSNTLSVVATPVVAQNVSVTTSNSLSVASKPVITQAVAMTTANTIAAIGTSLQTSTGTATVTTANALSISSATGIVTVAAVTTASALSVSGTSALKNTTVVTSNNTITASAIVAVSGNATVTTTNSIAATGAQTSVGTVAVTVSYVLSSSGKGALIPSVSVNTTNNITVNAIIVLPTTTTVTTANTIVAAGSGTQNVTFSLPVTISYSLSLGSTEYLSSATSVSTVNTLIVNNATGVVASISVTTANTLSSSTSALGIAAAVTLTTANTIVATGSATQPSVASTTTINTLSTSVTPYIFNSAAVTTINTISLITKINESNTVGVVTSNTIVATAGTIYVFSTTTNTTNTISANQNVGIKSTAIFAVQYALNTVGAQTVLGTASTTTVSTLTVTYIVRQIGVVNMAQTSSITITGSSGAINTFAIPVIGTSLVRLFSTDNPLIYGTVYLHDVVLRGYWTGTALVPLHFIENV